MIAGGVMPWDGEGADPARFDRLSPRQRDCLRGVRALKGSKEIAGELGIEKSTVDGYLTEAVRILGARNRREAALAFGAYEDALGVSGDGIDGGSVAPPVFTADPETPDKIGGHSARLATTPADPPIAASPDETIDRQPGAPGERPMPVASPGLRLPFRRKGQARNTLTIGDRLLWIQAIALGIAVGFGMLMTGLQALTGLIAAVSRSLS
ncbi:MULTISPECIES: helix-turn-helix transcriptional regulator [unclassified Sphingomonas]|uniref:helix-turn-helix domain-containing protein n=1 Tax=unclassified Sphingomonas TaxID=196159 RepID=UPI000E103A71|nr:MULTISPECIES: helix-turn-helix transcriptional regulator [unclassified Sphingomonas]AXJ96997.1 LuxR family transcriptional regulator [Sphingomonas sp. FARSPH]